MFIVHHKHHEGGYNNTNTNKVSPTAGYGVVGVFPALLLRASLHCSTPGAGNVNTDQEELLCSRAIMTLGLLEDMSNFLCQRGWVVITIEGRGNK